MKKLYTLIASALVFTSFNAKAQNVLLNMDFQAPTYPNILDLGTDPSTLGAATDTNWYVLDVDGAADGSPAGRPGGWYLSYAFTNTDIIAPSGDSNVVLTSNSWLSPAGVASNFFISPSVALGAHDTLFWKSAPYQTPRFLDGYQVLLSTGTNSDLDFLNFGTGGTGHVLFTAAEMTNILGTNDSVFSGYSFSSGFVHGLDGTFTEYNNDSARLNGVLRTFRIPLDSAGFANQTVFIAFHHNSDDDNLISIDDIMIRGSLPSVGVEENSNTLNLSVYPNPANDLVQVRYELLSETTVTISIYDVTGKLVNSISKGNQPNGRHFATVNAAELAKGFYTIAVQTAKGVSTTKLIVK